MPIRKLVAAAGIVGLSSALCACSGYSRTTVLQYMPETCKGGTAYYDWRGFVTMDGMADGLKQLVSKSNELPDKKAAKKFDRVQAALKAQGLDLARDIHEIAVCMNNKGSAVIGIGGTIGGSDALKKLGQVAQSIQDDDDEDLTIKTTSGVKYAKAKKGIVVQPAANVVLVAPGASEDDVADFAKSHKIGSQWGVQSGTVLAVRTGKSFYVKELRLDLTKSGSNVVLDAAFDGGQSISKGLVKSSLSKADTYLKGTPLEDLSEAVSTAKVEVEDTTVSVHAELKQKALSSTLRKIAQDPKALAKVGRGGKPSSDDE